MKSTALIKPFSLLIFLIEPLFFPSSAQAIPCSFPIRGNHTININCSLSGLDGVDKPGLSENGDIASQNSAALTIAGGGITLNSGATLVVGSLDLSGGSIAISSNAQIQLNTPIYFPDNDADGWPDSFDFVAATASGRRRRFLAKSLNESDCDSSSNSDTNSCCTVATYYADSDGDGYGAGSPMSMCPASGYVANNTDCNDANASVWQNLTGYTDNDGDGYGAGSSSTICSGASLPSGYASNNTDCYDSNANAYPSSTYCGTTDRGDGSFDYNCNSAESTCNSSYYSSANWYQRYWYEDCNRWDENCKMKCGSYVGGTMISTAASCGATGYLQGSSFNNPGATCYGGDDYTSYHLGTSGTQACQ